MTDIDSIIKAEKQQHHQLDDPDLLAFATLTQIAQQATQARIKTRFIVGVALCLLVSLIAFQAFALSNLGFSQVSHSLGELIARYPLALMVLNTALVVAVLAARRLRLI